MNIPEGHDLHKLLDLSQVEIEVGLDHEREAVVIRITGLETNGQIMLSPGKAADLAIRIVGATMRLRHFQMLGWEDPT